MKLDCYPFIVLPTLAEEITHEDFDITSYSYDEEPSMLLSMDRSEQIRYLLRRDFLAMLALFQSELSNTTLQDAPTVGLSEMAFVEHLSAHSNYTVLTQKEVRHFYPKRTREERMCLKEERNNAHYYYPDIIVIDEASSIVINVEIDEPYCYRDGEPTHFLNYTSKKNADVWNNDENRDRYFAEQGVWVVRFSEEQIVLHAHSCLSLLKALIGQYKRNLLNVSMTTIFSSWSKDFYTKRWTLDEALELSEGKYRDRYLSSREGRIKVGTPEKAKWVSEAGGSNTDALVIARLREMGILPQLAAK